MEIPIWKNGTPFAWCHHLVTSVRPMGGIRPPDEGENGLKIASKAFFRYSWKFGTLESTTSL